MNNTDNSDFNWDELMARIKGQNVIPVVGQGLYWVRTRDNDNNKFLLYQYLAEKLAKEMNFPPPEHSNHAFSKTVSRYLKENPHDYRGIKRFLIQNLASLYPISDSPLYKLARIKPFSLFINTTYDHFLEHILNSVRNYPAEALHHTYWEKQTGSLTPDRNDKLENARSSLVFNIYGSVAINQVPSYTEKDILETVVIFQKDMGDDPKNLLFQALKQKSLLFIGCGYNDWLFRFFIRTIANEPYQCPRSPQKWKFISDDFDSFNLGELKSFLKDHDSEVFYSSGGKVFVDELFDRMEKESQYQEFIIKEEDFPHTAFISFHGHDRDSAVKLTSNLREDGIKVWLDELELKPGDDVALKVINAIAKCPVFIPLFSAAAKQFKQKQDIVKYHIREWEWAFQNHKKGKNPTEIIPVIIDNTDWRYDAFRDKLFIHIPGGNREKDYEKLKARLLEIQNKLR